MPKDYLVEAESQISKAELYFNSDQYKRAAKLYKSAGKLFYKEKRFKSAKDCYTNAAIAFINGKKYYPAIGALKSAGDCSVLIDDHSNANLFYKKAIKHIAQIKKVGDKEFLYLFFSTLSYLCSFIEGKQEQGLDLIKKVKKLVDDDFFKESPLIGLVKNLTIFLRDKNEDYIERVVSDFSTYEFTDAEVKLLKDVLVIANANVLLKTKLSVDKEQYTTKDIINLKVVVDTKPLLEISEVPFYNYNPQKLIVNSIGLELSDNIIAQKKPSFPLTLEIGEKCEYYFLVRPHFQVDEPFIGPISLDCELDDKFTFLHQAREIIRPNLISPPPSLNISMKNLRPPLIGQTFPLEILIENKSDGDALELNIDVTFPKELKVIRGTTKKQVYSLPSNDNITWELNLKPLEIGDYEILMDITYKDPDQIIHEDSKKFPFAIKL